MRGKGLVGSQKTVLGPCWQEVTERVRQWWTRKSFEPPQQQQQPSSTTAAAATTTIAIPTATVGATAATTTTTTTTRTRAPGMFCFICTGSRQAEGWQLTHEGYVPPVPLR